MIQKSTPKKKVIELGDECDRCGHCCSFTSGFVLPDEIKQLAEHFKISEKEFKSRFLEKTKRFNTTHHIIKQKRSNLPNGRCIFLKNKQCTIHEIKPLYCKIANCKKNSSELLQWYNLNYFVNKNDPHSIREWSMFTRFNRPIKGGSLKELVKEKELKKILDYKDLTIGGN